MKGLFVLLTMVLLGFSSTGYSSPTASLSKIKEKPHVDLKNSNDVAESDEALKTSNNYGIGYYPVIYSGIYDLARPGYLNYGLGYDSYGSYGTQWSQYSGYNGYRYDGYYRRPFYPYWG